MDTKTVRNERVVDAEFNALTCINSALSILTDTQADPATHSEENQRAIENLHRAGEYLDNLAKRLSTN